MKIFIWKDKIDFVEGTNLRLKPNVVYKIGEDISEEDAERIVKSYSPHGLAEIVDEDKKIIETKVIEDDNDKKDNQDENNEKNIFDNDENKDDSNFEME